MNAVNVAGAIVSVHPFGVAVCSRVCANRHLDETKLVDFLSGSIGQLLTNSRPQQKETNACIDR